MRRILYCFIGALIGLVVGQILLGVSVMIDDILEDILENAKHWEYEQDTPRRQHRKQVLALLVLAVHYLLRLVHTNVIVYIIIISGCILLGFRAGLNLYKKKIKGISYRGKSQE